MIHFEIDMAVAAAGIRYCTTHHFFGIRLDVRCDTVSPERGHAYFFFRKVSSDTTSPVFLSPPLSSPPPEGVLSSSPPSGKSASPSSPIGWNCSAKLTDGSAKMVIAASG